jgi:hypothetical protein
VDRGPSQVPHPQAQAPAPVNDHAWGHNYRLTGRDHQRAILAHVIERAERSGKPVPCEGDMLQFMERSQIVLLDASGRQVQVDRVVVAWEER